MVLRSKKPIWEKLIPPEGLDMSCVGPGKADCPGFLENKRQSLPLKKKLCEYDGKFNEGVLKKRHLDNSIGYIIMEIMVEHNESARKKEVIRLFRKAARAKKWSFTRSELKHYSADLAIEMCAAYGLGLVATSDINGGLICSGIIGALSIAGTLGFEYWKEGYYIRNEVEEQLKYLDSLKK